MLRTCKYFALGLLLFSGLALAAPKKIDLVYQATRNGQPFATVTESFRQDKDRYRIESVTAGIGIYALFGKRRLISEGEVTAGGLKPSHFELHQGEDSNKSVFADFDWAANTLTLKNKGESSVVPLQKDTQDLTSYSYQFMFALPAGDAISLPVTTGKKLNLYNFQLTERNQLTQVTAGKYKTVHLTKIRDTSQSVNARDERELWLSIENHYLPVRLLITDDRGAKIEQILTSLHVE